MARVEAEEALRESEARLRVSEAHWRGLFERLNEGFMIVEVVRDTAGVARTWRFAETNAAWERISGLSQAAARGRNVDEVIPGIEQEWLDACVHVAETGEPTAFRMPLKAPGQPYDVRASRIAPDRVGVLFQEVSAQQRAELHRAALLELHDRLHDLDDPVTIPFVAAEVMGRALDVERAGYGTVHDDGENLTIERDWTAPGFVSGAGLHRPDSGGDAISGLRRGETIIDDISQDLRTRASVSSFHALATQALVNLPLIEGGRPEQAASRWCSASSRPAIAAARPRTSSASACVCRWCRTSRSITGCAGNPRCRRSTTCSWDPGERT